MKDDRLWQELNAYADGELQGAARARLEAALVADPALGERLERIAAVKGCLTAERPAVGAEAAWTDWMRPGMAIAACVVAGLLGIATFLPLEPSRSWQEKLVAAHGELSQETFVVVKNRPLPVVSSRRLNDFAVPNLRASRLYLVEARTLHDDATEQLVMHYRGLRGCALTIAAIAPIAEDAETAAVPTDDATLFASWRIGNLGFAVIAEGMDKARFQAIAAYVKAVIDDRLTPKRELRTAMADSYRAAKPCA